jgi:hypothetical protein
MCNRDPIIWNRAQYFGTRHFPGYRRRKGQAKTWHLCQRGSPNPFGFSGFFGAFILTKIRSGSKIGQPLFKNWTINQTGREGGTES